MLQTAINLADKLNIKDYQDVVVYIKRLPPSFTQKGIIEFPRNVKENVYIDIFIKYDAERYITLAHEMVHLRQILTDGIICEKEAYELEKALTMTTAF